MPIIYPKAFLGGGKGFTLNFQRQNKQPMQKYIILNKYNIMHTN